MMKKLPALLLGLALSLASQAATFNQFGPVTGVLKGSASTPITTAAAYTDIVLMWTGCGTPSTKVLMADGTCAVPSSVTPAALTKTDDTNVTLTLGGTPATALLQASSLTLGWTGTLAASRGGLGMSTVTDDTVAVANGSVWQSKALTDCDAASSAVTYDTTTNAWGCNSISGAVGANPTNSVGLTATNGVATTFTRSDSTHALSQAIIPTWTGAHTFTAAAPGVLVAPSSAGQATMAFQSGGASQAFFGLSGFIESDTTVDASVYATTGQGFRLYTGASTAERMTVSSGGAVAIAAPGSGNTALTVTGVANDFTQIVQSSTTSSQGYGLRVNAGTNATDTAFLVVDAPSSNTLLTVKGTGGMFLGAPTGGSQGLGTLNATGLYVNGVTVSGGAQTTATFTGTFTGVAGTVTCTMKYRKTGSAVSLFVNSGSSCTGTSNASTLTMTGLPAAIQTSSNAGVPIVLTDNSLDVPGLAVVGTSGTMTFYMGSPYLSTGFTASGVKGLGAVSIINYDLRN